MKKETVLSLKIVASVVVVGLVALTITYIVLKVKVNKVEREFKKRCKEKGGDWNKQKKECDL